MVSWAITGATRGIGFGYVDKLSANTSNLVFAVIRSRSTAAPLEALAAKRKNIHIIVTDIFDPKKLSEASIEISQITGGSLDVLILNAGSTTGAETSSLTPSAFHGKEDLLDKEINDNMKANVFSNIFAINAFLDLVKKGNEKKIVFITSQSGDIEFTRQTGFATMLGYSISKIAMNMVTTKFGNELAEHGVKTLSLAPGWVNTDAAAAVTGDPDVRNFVLNAFHKVDPNVDGPISVAESVNCQLQVIEGLSEANSGTVQNHRGDDRYF